MYIYISAYRTIPALLHGLHYELIVWCHIPLPDVPGWLCYASSEPSPNGICSVWAALLFKGIGLVSPKPYTLTPPALINQAQNRCC